MAHSASSSSRGHDGKRRGAPQRVPSFRPLRRERVLKKQRLISSTALADFDRARHVELAVAVHVDPMSSPNGLPRQHIGSIQLARLFRTDAGGVTAAC